METYLGLYILINVFCTAVMLLAAVHARIGMGGMVSQRLFSFTMCVVSVFYMSDTVWYAMDCGALPQIWWLSMLLKSIYFLSATCAAYLWFLYMGSLTRPRYLDSKRNRWLAGIPVMVHIVLCLVNLYTPVLFAIDADFTYSRGPLFILQYVFVYAYPIVASAHALAKAFRPENYIDRMRYIVIACFPLLPAISGILQLFYWRVPFNCVAFTLGMVIVYMAELSQQVSQEPLTKLANRRQLMRVLEQNMAAHGDDGQLYLYMMDLDGFKNINDMYGHTEGDEALIIASNALKQAVRGLRQRAVLARYGGDEFAIAVSFDAPQEAEQLKQRIKQELDRQSKDANKSYRLQMSIGVARCDANMHSIKDFLDAADAQLYLEKRKRNL